MNQEEFFNYINSAEFMELLKKYEDSVNSDSSVYLDVDEFIDIAEYYHMNGDWKNSEKVTDQCLALYPKEPAALLFKTRIALLHHEDLAAARHYFSQIEHKEEESLECIYVGAELLMVEGKVGTAEKYLRNKYDKFLKNAARRNGEEEDEEFDNVNYPLDVALLYMEHGIFDLALQWLRESPVPEGPQALDYWDAYGYIYTEMRHYDEAKDAWNKFLDLDSYNVKAWIMLFNCHFNMHEYEDALQCAEYILAIEPEQQEGIMLKAISLFALNEHKKALECIRKIKGNNFNSDLIQINYADHILDIKRLMEMLNNINLNNGNT